MSRDSLRVTFVLQDLAGGGAERVAVLLANGLAEAGHEITMFLVRKEGPHLRELSERIRLITPPSKRTFSSVLWIVLHLVRHRPDAVISHLTHVNVAALFAGRLTGQARRVFAVEHNQITQNVRLSLGAAVRLAYRLVPYVYPWAGRIVAVGHGVARDLESFARLPTGSVSVIHNPIVTAEMLRSSKESVAHSWFRESTLPVILAVGRLHPQKDFETLIRAFALVRKNRKTRLLILGEGEERARLEELIGDLGLTECVDLPGFVDNPFAYFARSSVFVLSSAWEGLPTVVVEALACGTQVVATDCGGGSSEILDGGRFGRLVPIRDPEALARGIAKSMDEPIPPSVLRGRAADFQVPVAVERYIDLIQQVTAEYRPNCLEY